MHILTLCRQLLLRALILKFALIALLFPQQSSAQVTNGDFSSGNIGWTDTIPDGSALAYGTNSLVATSDNNGGTNSDTYGSQSITLTEAGFLGYTLVSYTTTDISDYDYPIALIGGTTYRIRSDGVLVTNTPSVNNANTATGVSGVHALSAGTITIGFGVRATDSCCGTGIATWDDITFTELTQSPIAQTLDQDTSVNFSPQVASNATGTVTVSLAVSNGTVSLGSPGSVTITGGSNGSNSMTFTGTASQINTAMTNLTYTPTGGYTGADTLIFTASASTINDTDNIGITVNPVIYSFSITKTVTGPGGSAAANINAPQTLFYRIEIENTGNQVLTNPVLTDVITQGGSTIALSSGPIFDSASDINSNSAFDPSEQWGYDATYVVTQSDIDNAGDIINTGTFNADNVSANSASVSTTITASPSISVTKVANDTTDVVLNQTVQYTYDVTNNGNQTITSISLTDAHNGSGPAPVPGDEILLTDNGTTGDSTDTSQNGIWDTLAPGDVIRFVADYVITQWDIDNLQ